MSEHDAVTELPGAPATPDEPITVIASWHNAPGTGAVTEAPVETVRAFDKTDGGVLVAKVVEPPARPTRGRGRQAEAKVADTPPPGVDQVQADTAPAQDPESS